MRRLFTLLVLGLLPLLAWSQTRTITGKVVSSTAEPLIGVTVLVKGTTAGTVTDIEGNYSVNAPSDAKSLVFSSIGYVSTEIPIGSANNIDVMMNEDQISRREDFTAIRNSRWIFKSNDQRRQLYFLIQ